MHAAGGSRTAVLVCQGRAAAHGRLAVGRFDDPVAARLLTPDELRAVERARDTGSPPDARDRLVVESVRACAEVVVPRTVAIDDAVREAAHRQVVLVGAGLDSRPWRLPELRDAVVVAVDHPASQADARRRSAGLPLTAGRLVLVPVDLTHERLDDALAAAGHDRGAPTTWVWEGVVPYLRAEEVAATVGALSARSAAGSVLVVNYQSPSWAAGLGRRAMGLVTRLTGQEDPLAAEPWRSWWTPEQVRALLAEHRWAVRRDDDLLSLAVALASPATHRRSLSSGRVAVAVASA